MFRFSANKISLAASALLLCAGLAQGQTPAATPLTATWTNSPTAVGLTLNLQGDVFNSAVTVTVTAANPTTFDVDPASVPFWLTLGASNGTTPNVAVTFVANTAAEALGVGGYSANVHFKVSGFADLVVPVSLAITNGVNTLSVAEGTTIPITWVYGAAAPTQILTIVSSAQPAPFSVTTANTTTSSTESIPANWISASAPAGIAYSFGTPITISFLNDVLINAKVGATLTGTVTITYGAGVTIPVSLTITVGEPYSTVSSLFPTQAPPSTTTPLSVVVTGTGFNSSATTCAPATCGSKTVVTIAYTGSDAAGTPGSAVPLAGSGGIGGAINVISPTTMVLTIPAMDNQTSSVNVLAAGTITLNITNALTGESVAIETLTVTSNPVISSITDAASLLQATPPAPLKLAPYELISIFGSNFDTGAAVAATVDTFGRYPSTLVVPTSGSNSISVAFYKQGTIGAGTLIGQAYLIYVSNSQINALVPSGVTASGITNLQIVVTYGALSNTANPYTAVPVAVNTGVFSVGADGQGQGAILNSDYSVNSSTNSAKAGSTVMIYVSGMGAPTSTASDASVTTALKFPGSCISPGSYFAAVNALTTAPGTPWTSDDGAVILASNLGNNKYPPCFATSPTVSIGGQTATVTYAGWVADSVAGLYQINATVPTKAAASSTAPVLVTLGGVTSQAGVTMAIQ